MVCTPAVVLQCGQTHNLRNRGLYAEKLMGLLLEVGPRGLGIVEHLWRPIRPCKLPKSAANGHWLLSYKEAIYCKLLPIGLSSK
jgi:hypothetical protein